MEKKLKFLLLGTWHLALGDQTKKVPLADKKMGCLKSKNTQILIEFFDGTKKVQLVGKKSLTRD